MGFRHECRIFEQSATFLLNLFINFTWLNESYQVKEQISCQKTKNVIERFNLISLIFIQNGIRIFKRLMLKKQSQIPKF